jgi:DNA-binding Xre family transcriptional regulator
MKERLIKNFKLWFPSTAKKAIEYEVDGDLLIAILNDGTTVCYDDMFNTICTIKNNSDECLTDLQIRREFGRRVYRKMLRRNMSQRDLSEMSGLSEVMLSRYLTGKAAPGLQAIYKIAKALNCSTDELIYVDCKKD